MVSKMEDLNVSPNALRASLGIIDTEEIGLESEFYCYREDPIPSFKNWFGRNDDITIEEFDLDEDY